MKTFQEFAKEKSSIQVGDIVGYSKKFLQSTGQHTGDAPRARGKVKSLEKLGDSTLASVDWDKEGLPKKVNVANLSTQKRITLGEGMDNTITKTKIVRNAEYGEWIVQAYNKAGQRVPDADYYTDDKQDAEATAKMMVKP